MDIIGDIDKFTNYVTKKTNNSQHKNILKCAFRYIYFLKFLGYKCPL